MDGATVETRSGSADVFCPIGNADDGARGPDPILNTLTFPKFTVVEDGARSPSGP
jgi:hypothetical protein